MGRFFDDSIRIITKKIFTGNHELHTGRQHDRTVAAERFRRFEGSDLKTTPHEESNKIAMQLAHGIS